MLKTPLNILLIEDNPDDQFLIKEFLENSIDIDSSLTIVDSLNEGMLELNNGKTNVLLLDLSLPDNHGLEGLQSIRKKYDALTIIILTGFNDNKMAINAINTGAQDYLIKGKFNAYILEKSILYAYKRSVNEKIIRESEKKYKALYDHSPELLLSVYSTSGNIFRANKTMIDTTGFNLNELSEMNLTQLFHESCLQVTNDIMNKLQKNEIIQQCDAIIKTKDGRKIEVLCDVISHKDNDEGLPYSNISLKDVSQIKASERALKKSKKETMNALVKGQEEERKRMAKDLHDSLGQSVTGISLMLDLLQKQKKPNPKIINQAIKLINQITKEYRAITQALHPPFIEHGIIHALKQLCNNTESTFNIETSFNCKGIVESEQVLQGTEVELYRITQELLNNAIKHGSATQIKVELSKQKNDIQLTVDDNGIGFETKALSNSNFKKGIGLKNLETRASLLNATYGIQSEPNKGTSIKLVIPN